jgi:hypothetical protein
VAERPILFSAPMVRAILAGKKTQTRRLVTKATSSTDGTPWACLDLESSKVFVDNGNSSINFFCPFDHCQYLHVPHARRCAGGHDDSSVHRVTPRIVPTDTLWVRETFSACRQGAKHHRCVDYRADGTAEPDLRWTPSIYMPRSLSRITLRVTSVRVERLQAITEDDARAEGMVRTDAARVYQSSAAGDDPRVPELELTCRGAFAIGWDSINAKRALWATNPWVWVVGFALAEVRGG